MIQLDADRLKALKRYRDEGTILPGQLAELTAYEALESNLGAYLDLREHNMLLWRELVKMSYVLEALCIENNLDYLGVDQSVADVANQYADHFGMQRAVSFDAVNISNNIANQRRQALNAKIAANAT